MDKKSSNKPNASLSFWNQILFFKEMTVLVWKVDKLSFIKIVLVNIVLSFVPLGQAWISKKIFDFLAQVYSGGSAKIWLSGLLPLLIGQTMLTVLNTLLTNFAIVNNSKLNRQINLNSHLTIFRKNIQLQGLEPFENPETQSMMQLASMGIQMGPSQVAGILTNLLRSIITFFSFIFVLFSFDWFLAILTLFSAIPHLITNLKMNKQRFVLSYENTSKQRVASYFSSILTSLHFAKEIRLYNFGNHFIDGFVRLTRDINHSQMITERRELTGQTLLSMFSSIIFGLAYIFINYKAFSGNISIGDVTFYVSALNSIQSSISSIISIVANINKNALFFSTYNKFIEMPQPIRIAAHPAHLSLLKEGIEFRNVSFRYGKNTPWILNNINLFIPANQTTALVGLNGAGKTTLAKLLLRFYDPTKGSILWDGIDISKFDPAAFRKHIGAIFQDFNHYELSVFENIALGNIENINNLNFMRKKVVEAAQKAGIHEAIMELPKGYQTILSRWLADDQQGVSLSGGEWQKIALARMYIREAECLILDEPTAALDAKAEYDIYKSFLDLASRKTCVLISHRFSTVRLANLIAVLHNGKIVEYGSHENLLKINSIYAELYKKQAERYK